MSGVADFAVFSDHPAGSVTIEHPTAAEVASRAGDSAGIEIDIDEVIGAFQEQVGRLNQELTRRSKDYHGLSARRARLAVLKRELKRRREKWLRDYAEQSTELRHRREQATAEQARQAVAKLELEQRTAAQEHERGRLDERDRELAAERARLAARWESQTAFDDARTRLDHDQKRVLELHKRLEQRQTELAAREASLTQEGRIQEEARAALNSERETFKQKQTELAEAQTRHEAEMTSARFHLEADRDATGKLRERLEQERSELEYSRAALLAEQTGLQSERENVARSMQESEERQASLAASQARADEREQALRQNELDYDERRDALAAETAIFEERRVGLAHQAERLALERQTLEDLASQQVAEKERLEVELPRLREAQRELGERFAELVAATPESPEDDDASAAASDAPALESTPSASERQDPLPAATVAADEFTDGRSDAVHAMDGGHSESPDWHPTRDDHRWHDAEMRLLRRIANRSARSAISASAQRRMKKSLRWQAPFMVAAFVAAWLSHSICEQLSVGWSHLSTAWLAIGAIAVIIVIQSIVQAWSTPKP